MIFPTNFLWGASTSAFQVEGGYNEGGKGVATTDLGARRPGIADNKVAADHYHHWKEDVDLMAELGLKVYRMGFSWSRIMPDASGQSNPEGLAFYDKLIDYLLEKGIEPLVTLYHFECPQALVDAFGGWLDRKMIDAYLKYAEVCFTHFKGRVKRWVTVNEQLIATAAGIMNGNFEQDKQKNLQNIYQMSYHVSLAEHRAISLLRQINPEAQIGPVCAIQVVYPQSSRSEDVLAAENAEELMEFYLLDLSVRGEYPPYVASYLKSHGLYPQTLPGDAAVLKASTPDFIGINYYFSICAKVKEGPVNYDQPPFWVSDAFDICDNPHLRKTEWMDKGIDPMGLHIGMRKVYNRYRLPMIVTENGMAYSETLGPDGQIHDPYRIEYLKEHIEQLAIMIDEGLPVFGYCPWSFVDVVSSHQLCQTVRLSLRGPHRDRSQAVRPGEKGQFLLVSKSDHQQRPDRISHHLFSPQPCGQRPALPAWLFCCLKGVFVCISHSYRWAPSGTSILPWPSSPNW